MADILVTGGAGFVGGHVVRCLVTRGDRVRVLDPAPSPRIAGVDWRRGSVLDAAELQRALDGVDAVLHLAAEARLGVPDPGRYQRINVDGTAALLDGAARAAVRRIVVTSTAAILRGWNDTDPTPIATGHRRPGLDAMAGPYTRSKHAAATRVLEAQAAGLPVHLIYPTVPIGPGDPTPTPPTAMLRLFARTPPPAYLDGSLNLVDVRDVASAHLAALDHADAAGQHLVSGVDLDFAELLALLARLTGRVMPRRRIPWGVALAAAFVEESWCRLRQRVPTASVEGVRLMRHRRRHDMDDLARLGLRPRPIAAALRLALG